jgi:mannose-1-phosphate guanylyltransferase
MILAAGLGTRFRPVSNWTAKALAPVGDRPLLAHILEETRPFGGPLVINAHHHAAHLRAFLEGQGPNVFISEEKELLGTAGGLARARPMLGDEDVLVWSGDIRVHLDVQALRRAHEEGAGREGATLVVNLVTAGAGNVGIDAEGRVVRLRRETVREGEVKGGVFLAIHVFGAGLAGRLPEKGGLIENVYLPALRQGAVFRAWETRGVFHDIGTVATYKAANLAWLAEKGLESFVGEGGTVGEGVTLVRSVIGANAKVEGEGTLEECVVWPGATARAPRAGAIVTRLGDSTCWPPRLASKAGGT